MPWIHFGWFLTRALNKAWFSTTQLTVSPRNHQAENTLSFQAVRSSLRSLPRWGPLVGDTRCHAPTWWSSLLTPGVALMSPGTLIRAANARIQLGSSCSRAVRPDDPDRVVIHRLDGLWKEHRPHFLRLPGRRARRCNTGEKSWSLVPTRLLQITQSLRSANGPAEQARPIALRKGVFKLCVAPIASS